MSREHDSSTGDNQSQTDVLVFGRVSASKARAEKAPPSSGKQGGEQQLICI